MKRYELEQHLQDSGWNIDRFGHYHKTLQNGDLCRMKLQTRSVRYEKRITHAATQYSKAENAWVRLYSGYYGKLSISNDFKLSGMTR